MIPYNYVYCSDAQQLANEMSTGNKTSSLMYGIQYYINEDSTSWGNYFDSIFKIDSVKAKEDNNSSYIDVTGDKPFFSSMLLTTGASEYTNKMNIYDFAGNEYEWTLEKSTSTNIIVALGEVVTAATVTSSVQLLTAITIARLTATTALDCEFHFISRTVF